MVFLGLSPAGGLHPRHISANKAGDLLAVGLQFSNKVVINHRDLTTGRITGPVAEIDVPGNVTCVVWDE